MLTRYFLTETQGLRKPRNYQATFNTIANSEFSSSNSEGVRE